MQYPSPYMRDPYMMYPPPMGYMWPPSPAAAAYYED